jgi:hypothetical protein
MGPPTFPADPRVLAHIGEVLEIAEVAERPAIRGAFS